MITLRKLAERIRDEFECDDEECSDDEDNDIGGPDCPCAGEGCWHCAAVMALAAAAPAGMYVSAWSAYEAGPADVPPACPTCEGKPSGRCRTCGDTHACDDAKHDVPGVAGRAAAIDLEREAAAPAPMYVSAWSAHEAGPREPVAGCQRCGTIAKVFTE
jgi:hypothetical protein